MYEHNQLLLDSNHYHHHLHQLLIAMSNRHLRLYLCGSCVSWTPIWERLLSQQGRHPVT